MSWELTVLAMLAVTIGAAIYVAWPLLVGGARPEEFLEAEFGESALRRLLFQRDTIYATLKELEFDHAAGNISKEDFEQLQQRYKRKAVSVLKRIDRVRSWGSSTEAAEEEDEEVEPLLASAEPKRRSPDADEQIGLDIEQEIEAFRRSLREKASQAEAPSRSVKPSHGREGESIICPSCGHTIKDPGSLFCSRCGRPLGPQGEQESRPQSSKQRRRTSGGTKGEHRV